jgi:hypothetical protein
VFDAYDGKTVNIPVNVKNHAIELGVGSRQLYIADVTLRTRSGKSLSSVIQSTIGGQLVAVPFHCPGVE